MDFAQLLRKWNIGYFYFPPLNVRDLRNRIENVRGTINLVGFRMFSNVSASEYGDDYVRIFSYLSPADPINSKRTN